MHELRRINVEERRAVCTECGPVRIRSRGDGGWRCAKAVNAYKRRKRAADNEERLSTTALTVKTLCCGETFRLPPVNMRYARDGIVSQEAGVHCVCGTAYGISRKHQADGTDFLIWVVAEQLYEDGRLRQSVLVTDDEYEVMEIIDLRAQAGNDDGAAVVPDVVANRPSRRRTLVTA